MQIWCAAGVDLSGGKTKDGGSVFGATSVFYADSVRDQDDGADPKLESKVSMVWIGSSTHSCSKVTVVDANYPQNILDCFIVCTSHLLCITPVPGASEGDYQGSDWTLEGKIHVGFIQGCHRLVNGQGKNSSSDISNTRDSGSSGYPNTEKRVENTTRSGVFLTEFEVFG